MQQILECQRVVDESRSMVDEEREMIPLESSLYKTDLVINQHIMQMIDTDISWYEKTFGAILMELWKIQNGKTIMQTSDEHSGKEVIDLCDESHVMPSDLRLYNGQREQKDCYDMMSESVSDEAQKNWPRKSFQINVRFKSAMMCWETLEYSEQEEKTRKTIGQEEETNDDEENLNDRKDDEEHVESTVYMGNRLKIPVEELKLGVDDDASTLATQETWVKNLVYITNILQESKEITNGARNDGKNPSKNEDKKPAASSIPLEKSLPINTNDDLKDYGESVIEKNQGRGKEWKKKAKKTKEVIHIEFDTDDDMEVQPKNANDGKAEGKV